MNLSHSDSRRLEEYTQELLRMYRQRRNYSDDSELEKNAETAEKEDDISDVSGDRNDEEPETDNIAISGNREEAVPVLLENDETTSSESTEVSADAEDEAMEEFLRENPSGGFVKVQAYVGSGAFPVKDVRVTVTKNIGGKEVVFVDELTDESGKTVARSLPTVELSASQSPGGSEAYPPYSTYTLTAEKQGYITLIKKDMPIFPGVISIQPLEMLAVPKSQVVPPPIIDEEEEPEL